MLSGDSAVFLYEHREKRPGDKLLPNSSGKDLGEEDGNRHKNSKRGEVVFLGGIPKLQHGSRRINSIDLPKKDYAETLKEKLKYIKIVVPKECFEESLDLDVKKILK